jgi:hypothetical protein
VKEVQAITENFPAGEDSSVTEAIPTPKINVLRQHARRGLNEITTKSQPLGNAFNGI